MRNGKDEKWACKKMFCVNAWTLEQRMGDLYNTLDYHSKVN